MYAWRLRTPPLFFFSSRRRHTRFDCDWSSDVCSSDLTPEHVQAVAELVLVHRRKPGAPQPQPQSQPQPQQPSPQQAPSNPPSKSPAQSRPPAESTANGAGDSPPSEADWGAMPPEPVGRSEEHTSELQ